MDEQWWHWHSDCWSLSVCLPLACYMVQMDPISANKHWYTATEKFITNKNMFCGMQYLSENCDRRRGDRQTDRCESFYNLSNAMLQQWDINTNAVVFWAYKVCLTSPVFYLHRVQMLQMWLLYEMCCNKWSLIICYHQLDTTLGITTKVTTIQHDIKLISGCCC